MGRGFSRVLVAAGVLVGLALAGCASGDRDPADGPDAGAPSAGQGDAELHVVVIDPAVRPLAGAIVGLEGTALNATTGADGEARFLDLAPGAYVVTVHLARYFPARAAVTVAGAGDAKPVLVSLIPDDTAKAYVQVSAVDVFLDGAFTVGADAATSVGVQSGNNPVLDLPDGVPRFLQSEATWTSTQPLGHSMAIAYFVCPDGGSLCESVAGTTGESPIVVMANGTDLLTLGYHVNGDVQVPIFAVYDSPGGAGVILQQAVRVTTHAFYGYTPPPGWLFSRDGTPDPPA